MQKKEEIGITVILVLFITTGVFCASSKQKEQSLQNIQITMNYIDNGNEIKTNNILMDTVVIQQVNVLKRGMDILELL